MAVNRVGDETWDFVNTGGQALPIEPSPTVGPVPKFPARWRVFGPLGPETTVRQPFSPMGQRAEALVSAEVEGLTSIPDALPAGSVVLEGRDVTMTDDHIDFHVLFGGHQEGQQAYLMSELALERDSELIFGAGCDFWMQWWIDGRKLLDTLATSNRTWPFSRTDFCFRASLARGRHLLVVRTISGAGGWSWHAGFANSLEEAIAKHRFSEDWQFISPSKELKPPWPAWQPNMAVRSDLCLTDETIELEYQQPTDSGNVGIVFAAQDSGHYYYAYIPHWGQLWRARGFWAAIAKADGTGYIRDLKLQLMPNVPCHLNTWKTLKLQRRGTKIQMWVNGVKGPCVEDDSFGPGRAGVAGFSTYKLRHLKIDGRRVKGPGWVEGDFRGRPWRNLEPDLSLGDFQGPGTLCKLSPQEVILPLHIGRGGGSCHHLNERNSAVYFYRSTDQGRTWSRYGGPMPHTTVPAGPWMVIAPGVIRAAQFDEKRRCFLLRDSRDRGLSWSDPIQGRLMGDWERDLIRPGTWSRLFNLVALRNGTFLGVLLHGYPGRDDVIPREGQGTWGTGLAQPYCTLSADQGQSWSEPVPMDNATLRIGVPPDSPNGGFSETAVAQLPSGKLVAVARPYRSPFMWQTESTDGGQSWRLACYAPFSGAGGPVLIATRSGYLALIKRGPGVGLHFSADEGVNWDEGTMIDYPSSFNGSAVEIEDDVVLVVYPQSMDEIRPSLARVQRIRLTAAGPTPAE